MARVTDSAFECFSRLAEVRPGGGALADRLLEGGEGRVLFVKTGIEDRFYRPVPCHGRRGLAWLPGEGGRARQAADWGAPASLPGLSRALRRSRANPSAWSGGLSALV